MDKDPANIWAGSFVPPPLENPKAKHHWLPNGEFGSAHISLCADVYIDPESICVEWDKIDASSTTTVSRDEGHSMPSQEV
jgi:hypothetical protein